MILHIQIDLVFDLYVNGNWTGIIEIDSSSTLEDLHYAIQDAVCFENDHMYAFFISRTERSRDKQRFDDENGEIFTTMLESLFPLPKGRKLYYMFDYGDSWLFQIKRNRKKPHQSVEGVKYPRLVTEIGKKPEQYPPFEGDFT